MILAGFLTVQFALVSATFPLAELATDGALRHIDNAAHSYRIEVARKLGREGLLTGYDPYFNAGTMAGIAANPAAKLPAAIATMTSDDLSVTRVWKLYVFACAILAGICVPIALLLLRASWPAVVVGGTVAVLLWWVSVFRWYHTAGMVSFVMAAYLAVPYVAWCVRYLLGSGLAIQLVGLGLLGAIGLYVHPLFGLPIALFCAILLFSFRREIDFNRAAGLLLVVPAISVLPSLPWLVPVFFEAPLTETLHLDTHQSHVGWDLILLEPLSIWAGDVRGSRVYPLLLLLSASALWLTSGRDRKLCIVFVSTSILMVLYAGFGATFERAAYFTQPNRFAPVAYLFLVVPAALGIVPLARLAVGRGRVIPQYVARSVMFAGAGLLLFNLNELRREISTDTSIGHYGAHPPEVRDEGPYTEFLLHWLESNTDRSARILFETSRGRIHDGSHIAGYLAYVTDREFIGGHYPDSYFADFTDGRLFGRSIDELTEDAWASYADLYNLGWIVAHSDDSKAVFDRFEDVVPEATFRDLKMYRVMRDRNFFASGSGQVADRRHNRLVLTDVAGDEVVLRYHYLRGLRSRPRVDLEPVQLLDDPNPFIRVREPPAQLEIFFD